MGHPGRCAKEEEGRQTTAEGATDSPGEAGRPEHQEGGGPPPSLQYNRDLSVLEKGAAPSTEEGADLQGFTPAREHLSLWEIYRDLTHHNDRTHLSGGVPDDATWKSCWRRLALQPASWYPTPPPPSKVGHRFTAVLAVELRGVLDWERNSERLLVFDHVALTMTLGDRKVRDIWARIE